MRILQIVPNLGSGGAEHFVVELSNQLCCQGQTIELLSLFDIPRENDLRKSLDPRIIITSFNKKKGLWLKGFVVVWRYISKCGFDVVHAHVGAIKYITLASLFCKKVRFVVTIHSEARREAGSSVDKWSRKLMFCLKTCVPVTISNESERSFESFYGRKGVMIHNGVSEYVKTKDINLHENKNQIVFLHPASCQPVKNQVLLFSAFNKLLDCGYDVKLIWVGNVEIHAKLYDSLKPLMNRKVLVLGVVGNVRDYMVASDAICLSSKMEGMPMTIIEAFSVGCPVLCTPVGGCVNLIKQGQNGFMSSDLSDDSYYQMLLSFVSLPRDKRVALSVGAVDSFREYSIEKCSSQYLKVYETGGIIN